MIPRERVALVVDGSLRSLKVYLVNRVRSSLRTRGHGVRVTVRLKEMKTGTEALEDLPRSIPSLYMRAQLPGHSLHTMNVTRPRILRHLLRHANERL